MKWFKSRRRVAGVGLGVLVVGLALSAMLIVLRPSAVSAAPALQATATATKTAAPTKTPRPTRTPAPTSLPKVRKFPVIRTSTAWSSGSAAWDDIKSQLGLRVPPAGCQLQIWFAVESGGAWRQFFVGNDGSAEFPVSVSAGVRLSVVSVSLWDLSFSSACS